AALLLIMRSPSALAPHDPAWRRRVTLTLLFLVALWPMLVASEFRPWALFDEQSLAASAQFLASFVPPAHDRDFLLLIAEATWQTIAIATAGLALAWIVAVPLTLIATERLSISRLGTGSLAFLPAAARQAVRYILIVLRSIPELVWALLFVRLVGLGPTAGVLAIALTYAGMLGKVYA